MNPNNSKQNYRVTIILISIIVVATLLFQGFKRSHDLPGDFSDKWQAVFLTDGQVYFGKLVNYNTRFVLLQNVYYLKFAEGLQQEKAVTDSKSSTGRNLNLIKLGGEAHGPEDSMYISKDKILFLENLKDDSTVVQAIRNNSK